MSANEQIEELLSGFLDGELTAEELRQFELAMSADGMLAVKLEQLRQLGSDLRSVPKRKLAPDFASRVVAAARQEALDSHSAAAEYICEKPLIHINAGKVNRWRAVGAVSALAASLLFALYVSNWFPAFENVPENGDVVESSAAEKQDDSTLVRKTPPMTQHFAGLPIFEIEASLNAWNTNLVGTILAKEGIVWTKPVAASEEVIKVLNETRSINQGLPSSGDEQVSLVMVQASGRAIDNAMRRIYELPNDFPNVMMDLAFEMPGMELFEKVTGKPAFATPIASGAVSGGKLEDVSQFSRASSGKRSQPSSQFDSAFVSDAEDEISYVLLVIRKPAK